MLCINFRIRSKKNTKYFYCVKRKKIICLDDCRICSEKQFKKYYRSNCIRKNKRAISTDINQKVKTNVFKRDNGRCVICGNNINVMPNAHYISRAHGGLGIEENIVTLCTEFTDNKCHKRYDSGYKDEKIYCKNKIRDYLKSKYENWNEESLVFKKYNKG